MLQRRNIKLDRANKSILLRALGNVYYAQKATGSDCTATGALVLRIHALPPKGGRLALDMDEYRLARNEGFLRSTGGRNGTRKCNIRTLS